jgi:hypothetical protein
MSTLANNIRLRLVSACLRIIAVPLASAFLLLFHWTPAYATPSFEVSGRCLTTSWHTMGKRSQALEFLINVRVAGPVWSIRMTDLAAKAGKRASSGYSELVCDGEDIFVQVSLLTHPGHIGKGWPCRASCALSIPGPCIMS